MPRSPRPLPALQWLSKPTRWARCWSCSSSRAWGPRWAGGARHSLAPPSPPPPPPGTPPRTAASAFTPYPTGS
jgi:hypothetical protein